MTRVDEFLSNLQKSKLLTPVQWQIVRDEVSATENAGAEGPDEAPGPPTPRQLAGTLVEKRFLTPWQADMLLQGKKDFNLGKYKLLDCIGTGGMGAVFKALHGELGRIVAIKILSPGVMKNRQAVRRFQQEIQAVAALDDKHIVAAYDAGTYGNIQYLVMEYVEGYDLGYLIKHHSPLPVNWVCECIRQAALGLQHAHEKALVHRDIKPTNLLVAKDPDSNRPLIKILDLGLARFVTEMTPADLAMPGAGGEDGSSTQLGQFLGTPDYISPEQAHDTRAADIRSDIFSLGCTFFRLLTGELPFPGETVIEKLESRESSDALPVRKLRSEVPEDLEAVVARMLARAPAERYQTPREVAQALTPFARGAGILHPPVLEKPATTQLSSLTLGEQTRLELILKSLAACEVDQSPAGSKIAKGIKWASPRSGLIAVVAISCLAALMLWYRLSSATLVIDWPLDERSGATLAVDRRPIQLPPQQTFNLNGRPGTWKLSLRREGFEPIEAAATVRPRERTEFLPHWQPTPDLIRQRKLQELKRRIESTANAGILSPQMSQFRSDLLSFLQNYPAAKESAAARDISSQLSWPLDLLDGSQVPADERARFAAGSGDSSGVSLAGVFGDSRLKFWNGLTALAISGDGRYLAGASSDGTVQVYDLPKGRLLHVLVPPARPTELAFSPTAARLAVAGRIGSVTLWNAAAGTLAATLDNTTGPMAFSGDGLWVAGCGARQEIAVWDAQTGQLRQTMRGHSTGILRGLLFSHNGRLLASYGSDASVLVWDVASAQERMRFPNAQVPVFSPDDKFLAAGTSSGDLMLWDTATGQTQRTLDEGGYPLSFGNALIGEVSPIIVSKRLGRAILWSLETGDEIRTLVEVPELATVSRDGKWLAGGDPTVGEVRLWNLIAGGAPKVVNTAGAVAALACSFDSSTLVTGSRDGVVQIWALETGAEIQPAALPLTTADLSPDGRRVVGRQGDRVEIFDVSTGRPELTLATGVSELDSLSFSPDGLLVCGFGGWGFFRSSLRLWDAVGARELPLTAYNSGTVRTTAFSGDSQLLAVAGDSPMVTVWSASKRSIHSELDFSDRIAALAFHPDSRRLAVASHDQRLVLWDLKSGRSQTLPSAGTVCRRLAFSPDGRLLAAATDERVLIWILKTGKPPVALACGALTGGFNEGTARVNSIAFHPAGDAILAAGNEGCLWLWNDLTRKRSGDEPDQIMRVGPAHGAVKRVLWAPGGRYVLSVNGNGTIYALRLQSIRRQ
jgi:serine/threonine protein kinase/WD40 repeat protein